MSLKCFDYHCDEHGTFEKFWETDCENYQHSAPCPVCDGDSERVFVEFAKTDPFAFSAWNNFYDPQTGTFTDKKKYRQEIERQGRMIWEPGLDKDAAENEKAFLKKKEDSLRGAIREKIASYTLDELRAKIKIDAKIHDATMKGDANAIKAMGGMTSLDEAKESIGNACINVRKVS